MNTSTSNHQGLEIGRVLEVTPKKIKIKLTNNLYQEDGIRFKNSNLGMIANFIYNEKDLLINTANKGDIIYLDNKINLKEKDILIKTSSGHLDEEILSTSEKKIIITIDVLQINDYLEITFKDNNGNKVSDRVKTEVPQKRPTTNEEIKEKERVINNSESFLTLVPKSTKYTGEIRILFKKNIKFENICNKDIRELSIIFKNLFSNLFKVNGNLPFNIFIHSHPKNIEGNYFNVHIHIIPRKYSFGGFELGTGLYVSSIEPKDIANKIKF